jgi:sirohydrochlorin ferrochelatase
MQVLKRFLLVVIVLLASVSMSFGLTLAEKTARWNDLIAANPSIEDAMTTLEAEGISMIEIVDLAIAQGVDATLVVNFAIDQGASATDVVNVAVSAGADVETVVTAAVAAAPTQASAIVTAAVIAAPELADSIQTAAELPSTPSDFVEEVVEKTSAL